MRVIAGKYRSRRLLAPDGMATRPTSDRLKETLFNVLGPRVDGCRFADLYAGSGAVGIEAVSRGASKVWLAEKAPAAIKAIRVNLTALGITNSVKIETRSVKDLFSKANVAFDFIFLDPPYEAEQEYLLTLNILGKSSGLLAAGGIVIAEHAKRYSLAERYGSLRRARVLLQGDAGLTFYVVDEGLNAPPV